MIATLRAVHAMEKHEASEVKAPAIAKDLESMRLKWIAKVVSRGYAETPTYAIFPREHGGTYAPTTLSSTSTSRSAAASA